MHELGLPTTLRFVGSRLCAAYGTDFLLGHYQMSFELDHCFIWTEVGAPEAELLIEFGLTEGQPNTHLGQGTANRRFFFENVMLELLWIHNKTEAQSNPIQETRLWERWLGRRSEASPFGICLRPVEKDTTALPFPGWPYRPPYLPEPWAIHMGENSVVVTEPLCFYLAFAQQPDQGWPRQSLVHPAGFREVTALRIFSPVVESASAVMTAIGRCGASRFLPGSTHLMEMGFDGEVSGRARDFRPRLPLKLWR